VNVNITLLFSVDTYRKVVDAYLGGLEDLKARGGDLSKAASVASFFVSRIDTAVDKALEGVPEEKAEPLRGKVAIANAKLAYAAYKALFRGPRWEALAQSGARTQRLLWASTSTKTKTLKDTVYVEALIGRDTVDTLPPATMDAFRDHGVAKPDAVEQGLDEARAILDSLAPLGVDLDAIMQTLVRDGVQQFADAFDKLFAAIARQRRESGHGGFGATQIEPGSEPLKAAIDEAMEAWRAEGRIRQLWAGDATVWTGHDEDQWLGWLTIADDELADLPRLSALTDSIRQNHLTDIVLLGMGGSSLGPEVLAEVLGDQPGWPRFHMLDSTDPAQVKSIDDAIDVAKTLFIVSSKSGSTLEPNIFADHFWALAVDAAGEEAAAKQFVAITDPGSSLETRAKTGGWAHVFLGAPPIGGRYSVLSKFGLVPAAAMGLDIEAVWRGATLMARACAADTPPEENPGVQLGVALGVAAKKLGRDKVTIIASPAVAPLAAWLEQLLAESTGKQGGGLIPVADEPLAEPHLYGRDRFFAYVELADGADPEQRKKVQALAAAGHPVATLTMPDKTAIGQEFFRWEVAVAVAGSILGINPFDQPDVEASKTKTRALTDDYEKSQHLPEQQPLFREKGFALYADGRDAQALGRNDSLEGYLKSHFQRLEGGDYAAFLAYVARTPEAIDALTEIRARVRDRTRAATCVGFGPRFQHSTGQAYKGGPNSGVFLQITCEDAHDLPVPGHKYTFGVVKAAQAKGDLDVLVERGRRTLRVHLDDAASGLPRLSQAVRDALF
jgi:transaldolase/glucose-6-phosphate isomerase